MKAKKNKLTDKQRLFAEEYIKDSNATQAAIKAGYSPKSAHSIATENLQKPAIKSFINAKMKEIDSKKIMGAKEAIERLSAIARGELKETVVVGTGVGAEAVDKPADFKTQISAMKEILKRQPAADPTISATVKKLEADAESAEAKARINKYEADQLEDKGQHNPLLEALHNLEVKNNEDTN